jgi:hypothetical protein
MVEFKDHTTNLKLLDYFKSLKIFLSFKLNVRHFFENLKIDVNLM